MDFADSNVHFIEKTVPFFEQAKLASVKDLQDSIAVQDSLEDETRCAEKRENFTDYLHRKIPCQFKIDIEKKQYYDNIRNTTAAEALSELALSDEFIFDQSLPNGKLSIPSRDDDEDSEDDNTHLRDTFPEEMRSSLSKFCKAYNVDLSSVEKRAMLSKNSNWKKRGKRKLVRNAYGKFVKQIDAGVENPEEDDDFCTEQSEIIPTEDFEIEGILPETVSDILDSSEFASVFSNLIKRSEYDDRSANYCEALKSTVDESFHMRNGTSDALKLFRPFNSYWMYHCNFSRVKPKNFELFEKMLPRSFRWLLNECASIVEMTTEDLYEEVCLIEAYYTNISVQSGIRASSATENVEHPSHNQAYINAILNKW